MKYIQLKNQSGAVLAFSLVMLLLLTLVGTSMIRQNKVQISLTGNSGQQTQTFNATESALTKAQIEINKLRYVDPTKAKDDSPLCKSNDQIHPAPHASGIIQGLGPGVEGKVTAVYCISGWAKDTGGVESQCLYSGTGVRNTTLGYPAPTQANVDACLALNAAGGNRDSVPKACQIEEYQINVTLTDSDTGARRTVQSRLQVNCSGNLN